MLCIIKNKMLFYEITKSQLYRHLRSQRTWKVTIASLRKVATVFGADMSKNADLNFRAELLKAWLALTIG